MSIKSSSDLIKEISKASQSLPISNKLEISNPMSAPLDKNHSDIKTSHNITNTVQLESNSLCLYSDTCSSSIQNFKNLLGQFHSSNNSQYWNNIPVSDNLHKVKVYKHKTNNYCYLSHGYIPSLPGSTFDLLSDAVNRPSWDVFMESSEIVSNISNECRILYTKLKPVWPAAPRDSLLLTSFSKLSQVEWAKYLPYKDDSGYYSVSTSVTHPSYPIFKDKGLVRMDVIVSGYLILKISESDMVDLNLDNSKSWCKLIQIVYLNFDSWIPSSIINLGN
ncbi:Acyl-coenzyme A thioesterase 12 [Smittium culicis]|uniref:Acyl-coenzyme A thioesterase 12 n=1 Tax=Smittium culicis TaxID=133412 RepID=A0A1R1XYH8_9FUNG|nr:Acyl-coenzyme A thioesterase 12 [Smittium culicis]